jgi:hypothetical protein
MIFQVKKSRLMYSARKAAPWTELLAYWLLDAEAKGLARRAGGKVDSAAKKNFEEVSGPRLLSD